MVKKNDIYSINFVWFGILFGMFYWCLESVRDVIVFEKGDILYRLFSPDPLSFWMRIMVVCVLILFGVFAQSHRVRIEKEKLKKPLFYKSGSMIGASIIFGSAYWILESTRDVISFQKGDFIKCLFLPEPLGFWMRILAICIIVLLGIYAQNLINQRRKTEEALRRAQEELEILVAERTEALSKSNTLLKQEIIERECVEMELRRVNRALKTLSACNEIMVRVSEEKTLLDQICQEIVETGGYRLVWVGLSDKEGKSDIKQASQASNDQENLDLIHQVLESSTGENCPIARAIITGESCIVRDLINDNLPIHWRDEAVKRDFDSIVCLPLVADDDILGALNIYGSKSDLFDSKELELLKELANDLAFGIMAMRTRTVHKKIEQEKEQIQAQLLHSQKIEAVGVLAGGVAHDFNNLLTAIQVSADLAMMETNPSDPIFQNLQEIHRVSKHAAELAKQLLLFSRKHPMELNPINLNESLEMLKKMLRRLLGEDITIDMHPSPELWTVWADRGTMDQVIMNLALNARDAMPNGGTITIHTENVRLNKTICKRIPESRTGKFVKVTFSDIGIGMDRDTIQHIFEPFFSTKGPGKGTGLGLSVVYGIIKQHEGWINVTSELGKGATFEFYLPAVYVRLDEEDEDVLHVKNLRGDSRRILFIEDEVKVSKSTATGLEKNGYVVFSASNAEEAVTLFDREKGNFDIIFSDVVLPDMNGIDLVERLHSENPNVQVLLSSGYAEQKANKSVVKEKGFLFLSKPYTLASLLQTVWKMTN